MIPTYNAGYRAGGGNQARGTDFQAKQYYQQQQKDQARNDKLSEARSNRTQQLNMQYRQHKFGLADRADKFGYLDDIANMFGGDQTGTDSDSIAMGQFNTDIQGARQALAKNATGQRAAAASRAAGSKAQAAMAGMNVNDPTTALALNQGVAGQMAGAEQAIAGQAADFETGIAGQRMQYRLQSEQLRQARLDSNRRFITSIWSAL